MIRNLNAGLQAADHEIERNVPESPLSRRIDDGSRQMPHDGRIAAILVRIDHGQPGAPDADDTGRRPGSRLGFRRQPSGGRPRRNTHLYHRALRGHAESARRESRRVNRLRGRLPVGQPDDDPAGEHRGGERRPATAAAQSCRGGDIASPAGVVVRTHASSAGVRYQRSASWSVRGSLGFEDVRNRGHAEGTDDREFRGDLVLFLSAWRWFP